MSTTGPEVIPYIFYQDLPAALNWLARVFGFTEEMRDATPNGGMHGQMLFGERRIMMGQCAQDWGMVTPHEAGITTMGVFIYLDDVDGHYGRALAEGAEILHPPRDVSYGRTYCARDLDGHPWFFTARPRATE